MRESPKDPAVAKPPTTPVGSPASKLRAMGLAVVGMVLVVALLGLALLAARSYALSEIQRQAAERGVELWPGELKLGFFYVRLENSRFTTQSGIRVDGTIGLLRFEFDGLRLQKIRVEQVSASGRLTRGDLRAAIEQPVGTEPAPERDVVIEGSHVTLTLTEPTSERPWLLLKDFSFERRGASSELKLPEVGLMGVNRGAFTATLTDSEWRFQRTPDASIGALEVLFQVDPEAVTADVQFSQASLAALLGDGSDNSGVSLKGSLHAKQSRSVGSAPVGDMEVVLEGVRTTLPGNFGLGSLGSTVSVRSPWALDARYETLNFPRISVSVGPLLLAGTATVQHLSGGASTPDPVNAARLVGQLRGSLSCQELAQAFVRAQLGAWLGNMVSKPASQWVKGQVQIELKLDSKLSALASQAPQLSVGIGCGFKAPPELTRANDLLKGSGGLSLPTSKDLKWLEKLPDLIPTLPDP